MTPKCMTCKARWMLVPFTEIEHAGRGSSLGGKVMISFLGRMCFEVTTIHLRRAVRQAIVFIDLEPNKKYVLGI